jgi:hypothetical protein
VTPRGWIGAVVLVAVSSLAAPAGIGGAGEEDCGRVRAAAGPDAGFNERYAAYGNDNALVDDWTGGDGTYSVRLPDGRDAWIFSDSFLGEVREDGSRPTDSPFINNSMVLQEGEALIATLYGGTPDQPTALFVPKDESSWYWPQEGMVEGDRLHVFLQEFVRTGPDPWDFEWVDTDVATLSLPDLTLRSVTPVAAGSAVAYGAAVVQRGAYTYVYGVEDRPSVNHLHLARAPRGDLTGPWEFRTASGWSPDPADTARLLAGVGNGLSVTPIQGRFVLLTMADSDFFGNEIVVRVACLPWGPWGREAHVYTTPENEGGLFSYNAHAHEQFTEGGRLLVSYDVNTFRAQDLWRDVAIYRPRFLAVDLRLAP